MQKKEIILAIAIIVGLVCLVGIVQTFGGREKLSDYVYEENDIIHVSDKVTIN